MQVSIESTSALEKRLTVGVPAAQIESEIDNRLKRLARTQRIDGFRPGKVPFSVIKGRFGPAVRQEVIDEAIRTSFYDAIRKEKLNPAGGPTIESVEHQPGQDLSFVATFEVFPEVKVQGLEQIQVEKVTAEVTPADIETMLSTLQKQQAKWELVERPAADADQVVIDFEGKINDEPFEGGKAEKFPVTLGSGSMIPGFEEGLKGLSKGDAKDLQVTFPADYHVKELAGQAATFSIQVREVREQQLPELNDEFAGRFGVAEKSLDALKAEVAKNMQRELRQTIKARLKAQVFDALVDKNPIEIPKALVAEEIERLRQEAVSRYSQGRKLNPDQIPTLPDQMFRAEAEKRVRLGLLVRSFISNRQLTLDGERVRATVAEFAEAYEQPEQIIEWYYSDEQRMEGVKSLVMEEQVVDLILEQASISEVSKPFAEVMNRK